VVGYSLGETMLNSDFEEIKDVVTERMHELNEAVDCLDIDYEAKQYLFGQVKEVQLGMYTKLDCLSKCIRRMDGLILTSELLSEHYSSE
jgi:hypothetical protein